MTRDTGTMSHLCLLLIIAVSQLTLADVRRRDVCSLEHTSKWGDKLGEIVVRPPCMEGLIDWKRPRGQLKLTFQTASDSPLKICLTQQHVSPWTSIMDLQQEVGATMRPLPLPFTRPTCATSGGGPVKLYVTKPFLTVYRTTLQFTVSEFT